MISFKRAESLVETLLKIVSYRLLILCSVTDSKIENFLLSSKITQILNVLAYSVLLTDLFCNFFSSKSISEQCCNLISGGVSLRISGTKLQLWHLSLSLVVVRSTNFEFVYFFIRKKVEYFNSPLGFDLYPRLNSLFL